MTPNWEKKLDLRIKCVAQVMRHYRSLDIQKQMEYAEGITETLTRHMTTSQLDEWLRNMEATWGTIVINEKRK